MSQQSFDAPIDGTILFARYAFMPNRLNYCGGDDNQTLFDYCVANQTDAGLVSILVQFQAALPYLNIIAACNRINDPFDRRVVEAYWIGNELLTKIDLVQFYKSLNDRFSKRLSSKTLGHLLSKPAQGARPHHSFHVFDVHSRTGMLEHNIENLENCRIGWGRVKEIQSYEYLVEHRPLELHSGKLQLGDYRQKNVIRQIGGTGFVQECRIGDWISFHWDWVCDKLTPTQVRNLEQYTRYHIILANRTV